jgi:hypothetical protein
MMDKMGRTGSRHVRQEEYIRDFGGKGKRKETGRKTETQVEG